jgi:hypothetical protein
MPLDMEAAPDTPRNTGPEGDAHVSERGVSVDEFVVRLRDVVAALGAAPPSEGRP